MGKLPPCAVGEAYAGPQPGKGKLCGAAGEAWNASFYWLGAIFVKLATRLRVCENPHFS